MPEEPEEKSGFLERLNAFLMREPENRPDLLKMIRSAFTRGLMDSDALSIIEAALSASEIRVTEIMVPRAQMDVIHIRDPFSKILPFVIQTAHSRFPVVDNDKDDVLGILLAKDLLKIHQGEEFKPRDWLRPAIFVPESKRLNVLLREFRVSRNHMAMVVNEYGGVLGLVTIEDVLEQIVGDIEDEYDFDETHDNIRPDAAGRFRVKARTAIDHFNDSFSTHLSDKEFDTIGGFILRQFGRVPKCGEVLEWEGLRFEILRADSRRLYTLLVKKIR